MVKYHESPAATLCLGADLYTCMPRVVSMGLWASPCRDKAAGCHDWVGQLRGLHAGSLGARKLCVTRRKLQTPGTAEEHKRQETPTVNPTDRQPTRLTDQAPSTIERAAWETHNTNSHSIRARLSTATTRHHHPHPTGSSPDPLRQCSPLQSLGAIHRRAEPHYTIDTTHLAGASVFKSRVSRVGFGWDSPPIVLQQWP